MAAVGGTALAALPIVDGLLARVPAARAAQLPDHPGVRAVTDADRPLHVRAADPTPGGVDSRSSPRPVPLASPSGGPRSRAPGVTPAGTATAAGVAVGVLDSRLELELPDGPLEVDADPLRLVQVLANLISNAHKYSPTDQEVRVWRDNGWTMAAVADRGRGIPPRSSTGSSRSSTGSRTR